MTITYTSPQPQPNITRKRLIHFVADPVDHMIIAEFEKGFLSGGVFTRVGPVFRRIFTDDTTPSFANFVAACPAAGPLRNQVETYETTLDAPGSVD